MKPIKYPFIHKSIIYFNKQLNILNEHAAINKDNDFIVAEIKSLAKDMISLGIPDAINYGLEYALMHNHKNIINSLLSIGADPTMYEGSLIKKLLKPKELENLKIINKDYNIDLSKHIKIPEEAQHVPTLDEFNDDVFSYITDKQDYTLQLNIKNKKEPLITDERIHHQYISEELEFAVKMGKLAEIKQEFNEGTNIYAKNNALLVLALKYKKHAVVDFLLEKKSQISIESLGLINKAYQENDHKLLKVISKFYQVKAVNTNDKKLNKEEQKYYRIKLNGMHKAKVKDIEFENYLYESQYKYNEKELITNESNNLQDNLNKIIFDNNKEPQAMWNLIAKFFMENKISVEKENDFLENALEYAVIKNLENGIDVLLNAEINISHVYESILKSSIENKNLNRIKLLSNFKSIEYDLSTIITIPNEKEKLIYDYEKLDISLKNVETGKEKEHLEYLIDTLKKCYQESLVIEMNNFIYASHKKYLRTAKTNTIAQIEFIEEKEEKEILEPKVIEQVKKELPITNNEPKEMKTVIALNGTVLSRKEIQQKWDKTLCQAFYNTDVKSMRHLVSSFLKETHLDNNILNGNDINIFRMPLSKNQQQLLVSPRRFVCNYLAPLAEVLFKTNLDDIEKNPEIVLKKIVSLKIRTSALSHFESKSHIQEEKQILKETNNDFKEAMDSKNLFKDQKRASSSFNWKTIK